MTPLTDSSRPGSGSEAALADARQLVLQATDPARSVVVQACAGSGKTWMLVTRIFRLLLAGASPDGILAITFTRKAAEEMRQRLDELLEQCVLLPDDALHRLLAERCTPASGPADLVHTRQAALAALRAPRGVDINTFHGWFTSLCQLAPLACGFSRQAEPSELSSLWQAKAWETWMARLRAHPGYADAADLFALLVDAAEGAGRAQRVLMALVEQRAAWSVMYRAQGLAGVLETLRLDFGIEASEQFEQTLFDDESLSRHVLAITRLLGQDPSATQQAKAQAIEQAWTQRQLEALLQAMRVGEQGQNRSKKIGPTQKLLQKMPAGTEENFLASMEVVQCALDRIVTARQDQHWYRLSALGLQLLPSFFSVYDEVKAAAGVLDFDDLEITAQRLLTDEQWAAYLQMRLDRRTQHVLIDEFQDTNPLQWLILKSWLGSYHIGDGPTVFMVGDPKQSIYRFRRAEAALFPIASQWLVQHFGAIELGANLSRRCAVSVLEVVNGVFTGPAAVRMGRTRIDPHLGVYDAPGAGLYRLPLLPLPDKAPPVPRPDWLSHPLGPAGADSAAATQDEAWQVGQQLALWLRTGVLRHPGQVMVLVRRHDDAVPLSEVLQSLGIAHTVNDKGGRFASLLWADSQALLRVLFSPLNAVSTVQLLRSPFFDLSAAQITGFLTALGAQPDSQRNSQPIDHALLSAARASDAAVRDALEALGRWRSWADALPLHDVLDRVFRESDVVARSIAMAPDHERKRARDHWAWMLDWSLDINKGRFPHLPDALEQAAQLTRHGTGGDKAEPDPQALRILTVHSAKGLEADLVWLFNANRVAGGDHASETAALLNWPPQADSPAHLSVYAGRNRLGVARRPFFEQETSAQADEADHLLYVALTRARQRLVVSGVADKDGGVAPDSWYGRLHARGLGQEINWSTAPEGQCAPDAAAAVAAFPAAIGTEAGGASRVRWQAPVQPAVFEPAIGEVLPRTDNDHTRRGEAWHACLQWVNAEFFDHFEAWWRSVQAHCESALALVDDETVAEIRTRLAHMAVAADLRPWLDDRHCDEAHNEFAWMDADGRLHRADRIVRRGARWSVIDYKWSWSDSDLPAYHAQLRRYAMAIRHTWPETAEVGTFLVSSEGVCCPVDLSP